MKRMAKQSLCALLVICVFSSLITAFASTYSSQYLDSYRAMVTPQSGGKIAVTVDVSGVGYQERLGATYIVIYESEDGQSFKQVGWYGVDDYPEMMSSGTFYYKTPVTYSGTAGYYYFASVYCFAGNSTNGDERNYTTAIKRAIA